MRDLNSMFLDEGFGTLDEDTLETVGTTLERLSLGSERMIGIITHVPALAERVPVRFVVSRAGTTSTLRREGRGVTMPSAPVPGAPVVGATVPFTVDPWDPAYGQAFGDDQGGAALEGSSAELVLDLELPAADWRPLDPDPRPALPDLVLFLDGVRRIDARVWVHGGGQPAIGIAASLATGIVACDGTARVVDVAVERGLFTSAPAAADIVTRAATYQTRPAQGPGFDQLSLALQQRLSAIEVELALSVPRGQAGGR